MKKFWTYAGAFAMVLSLAAYAGAVTTLQDEEQIFEGELVKIDPETKVVTVKGAEDKEMQFTFTEQTEIVGADAGIQGLTGKPGTRLKVHYKATGESLSATRIEVSAS